MGDRGSGGSSFADSRVGYQLIVILFASLVYLGGVISPPSLMDDVDSVQAQIARNMLESGDWVTAHLDGVKYLEKSPLKYWMIAVAYKIFGVHDWAARIPIALSTILLCWVVARFAEWAFGRRAGLYAGLVTATSVGVFLFTRILIPDVVLTLAIAVAMWSFLRALGDRDAYAEPHPFAWAMLLWASVAVGLLLKGLIAALFPAGTILVYLACTRRLFDWSTWKRLHLAPGILLLLAIAAPWHVLATIRNPPYFDFTMHSEHGSYHGFFWFYFINEHVLRFLNRRYPHDYNTVPRLWFWLFHLLWLFPWSVYFPAVFRQMAKQDLRAVDRASRTRLLALCWTGFILVFFTFSTTQEYYSMPCYPALALLLASAMAAKESAGALRIGTRVAAAIATVAGLAIFVILAMVWNRPAPGDISQALEQHPEVYTLSLGHMADLTLAAFAYLRLPLAVAGIAFLVGATGSWRLQGRAAFLNLAVMMVLFFHAARLALVVFDPYMGSRALAEALLRSPEGRLIIDNPYYEFSSIFFYTGRTALLLNGRINNLVYGSYAPGAPDVFIDDAAFVRMWQGAERCYVVTDGPHVAHLEKTVGRAALRLVAARGGKALFTNQ